jgi:hypothetical protein
LYCDISTINKYNLSRIFNRVIGSIFKINKRLTIYCIVFLCILIGKLNLKTSIYKYIACYGAVAGMAEDDTAPVVAEIVAYNCVVVAGRGEADAAIIIVGIIARGGCRNNYCWHYCL